MFWNVMTLLLLMLIATAAPLLAAAKPFFWEDLVNFDFVRQRWKRLKERRKARRRERARQRGQMVAPEGYSFVLHDRLLDVGDVHADRMVCEHPMEFSMDFATTTLEEPFVVRASFEVRLRDDKAKIAMVQTRTERVINPAVIKTVVNESIGQFVTASLDDYFSPDGHNNDKGLHLQLFLQRMICILLQDKGLDVPSLTLTADWSSMDRLINSTNKTSRLLFQQELSRRVGASEDNALRGGS